MLKITDGILFKEKEDLLLPKQFDDKLGFEDISGVYIPDRREVDTSSSEVAVQKTALIVRTIAKNHDIFLFIVQSAWQKDTPRMNYLGIQNEVKGYSFEKSIVAQEKLEQQRKIRFSGLFDITPYDIFEALEYIIKEQRYAFLVLPRKNTVKPNELLSALCDLNRDGLENSKQAQLFNWALCVRNMAANGTLFIKSVGWDEQYCDVRFILISMHETLSQLLHGE